jgi:magnesium chelatase family protein
MIAKTRTATLQGIDALEVTVEAGVSNGLPYFALVGLPDASVKEAVERVRSAIRSSGFDFPMRRIAVNLAPADMRKEGPGLDLPIAVSILAASGQVGMDIFEDTMIAGELGLDGLIRPVNGAVSMALLCQDHGIPRIILPDENAAEATVAQGVDVFPVSHLREVCEILNEPGSRTPLPAVDFTGQERPDYGVDFCDVKGQGQGKRCLEIAAAGGHNVIMIGSPGSGKTMLARRLPTILPQLTQQEAVEVTRIYSSAGMMNGRKGLIWERPFRAPHHGASHAAIVGGGKIPRPGQVSLAHHGVLFLDEMPEFDRNVLEGLRQPLEDGIVSVARVQASLDFPAEVILVGAMNPCPCGFHGDRVKQCTCSPDAIRKYMGRISGPLLDRIDLHIEVPRLNQDELMGGRVGEPSEVVAERVRAARDRQTERFAGSATKVNARMSTKELKEHCPLSDGCKEFLRAVSAKMGLSARVFDRAVKVARTIADLAGDPDISEVHLSEAVQYRSLDRGSG